MKLSRLALSAAYLLYPFTLPPAATCAPERNDVADGQPAPGRATTRPLSAFDPIAGAVLATLSVTSAAAAAAVVSIQRRLSRSQRQLALARHELGTASQQLDKAKGLLQRIGLASGG
jgi:hypothetical protein